MHPNSAPITRLLLLPCLLLCTLPATGSTGNTHNPPKTIEVELQVNQPDDLSHCYDETSVFDLPSESDWLRIVPNPNVGAFTLELSGLAGGQTIGISIYDINGRKVHTGEHIATGSRHSISLNLEWLPKGVYFVHAQAAGRLGVQKLTII